MRTPTSLSIVVGMLAASQLGATDCGEVIRDPGFDLWCGDQLCSWKVDHGEVAQVPTWHEGDDGVELVGADTAIYQLSPVTSADGVCLEFELLADVEPGVDLRLQVDVFGDGSVELDEQIPSADWRPLVYRFDIAGVYDGVQFWIVKRGAGRAVVAQLQAHTCGQGTSGSQTITGLPAPGGAHCAAASDCASGTCQSFGGAYPPPEVCGECVLGATCPDAGDVCGLALPTAYTLASYATCVPAGSKRLGELCGVNAECADGACSFGTCSTCFGGSCGGGELCATAIEVPAPGTFGNYPAPLVCSPAGGLRAAGEPCVSGPDCASGACNGAARQICTDGRPCANDADCPVGDGLEHGSCATVGVIGGTCQ